MYFWTEFNLHKRYLRPVSYGHETRLRAEALQRAGTDTVTLLSGLMK
jgi:hypothetical protein